MRRNRSRRPALILLGYCLVGVLCTVLIVNTLRPPVGWGSHRYSAEFTEIGGLAPGSDVTMTGVRVGQVINVRRQQGSDGTVTALVDFEVGRQYVPARDVRASVRYGDMLGIRYLSLDPAPGKESVMAASDPLPDGSLIPLSVTTEPVDLTALINGFKPLFEAIDPKQVNSLSRTVIAAFQGEPGAMDTMLARLALVSRDVVDRQDVYTRLIENVTELEKTLVARRGDLVRVIRGVDQVSNALARDDGAALATLVEKGERTASTVQEVASSEDQRIRDTLSAVRTVTEGWVANTPGFDTVLGKAPGLLDSVNRTVDQGGFIQLYLCNLTARVDSWEVNLLGTHNSKVCR